MDALINLLVCPHGLTDLWTCPTTTLAVAYGGSALAATTLPDDAVLAVFLAVSAQHLGAVVWAVALAGLCSVTAAKALLLAHMLLHHLPTHYADADMTIPRTASLIAFGVVLEGMAFRPLHWPRITTGIVAGHVAASVWA